ncbi:protein transporter Sec31 [Streptomyces marianii]|uniref:Protein transporter Sec31 n=1 Tax=Streptomyces marianii TaxID=1817406 RepID=A0A5R9ECH2_9ACTN|nr:protein transporter Sec31 [Streptomyces marianii]TLQ45774.1 protein transporter Sec31 [Streptomyces marianii]
MRFRTETRTRQVPHTIGGITHLVDDPYNVHVPVPPRDWDRTVRTGVTVVAAVVGVASVAWSTAAISGLLGLVVVLPAAIGAAIVFDAVWMSCMALEWLARYDPARAQLPRRAGHAALGCAMAAVAVHGYIRKEFLIGLVGALVSGLAKGLWTVVLAHYATPLDKRTQQWVDIQRAEVGGQLAMVAVRRDLLRAQGMVAAEQAALAVGRDQAPDPDTADPDPDDVLSIRPSVRQAVETAWSSGMADSPSVLAYVRKVADPDARQDTVDRYLREIRKGA